MIYFKNAKVYDGSTNDAIVANILVDKDKIIKISDKEIDHKGAKVINCINKILVPRFIDAHSHNDFYAGQDNNLKYFEPFIRQGVTTMVTGNCGFSAAGYLEGTKHNHEIGSGLFDNKGKDFGDFDKWGKIVDKKSPVNIISLIGHGSVRISINSMASNELNTEQYDKMLHIIDKSLTEGAAGVSLGLTYEPSRFAPMEELLKIAKVVKEHNKILSYHSRAMSKVSTSYSPPIGGRPHLLRAIDEIIEIAEKTGVKTQISHLIFVGEKSWSCVDEALEMIENARNKGIDIMFDLYAMDFGASIITVILPAWYLSLDDKDKKKLGTRLRLAIEIAVSKKALGFGFDDILVSNTKGMLPEIEGKTVSQIAKEWGKSVMKTYLEIVDRTQAKADVLMYKYANDEIIERLRKHPLALYMTDAWVTDQGVQNFAIYYNFPKFIKLAMDNKTSIAQAINKMTGATADRYMMKDRGYIKEGMKADITIIDLEKLSFKENVEEYPKGIEYVIVNGNIVLEEGELIKDKTKNSGRFIKI